jgi:hypothetical protein
VENVLYGTRWPGCTFVTAKPSCPALCREHRWCDVNPRGKTDLWKSIFLWKSICGNRFFMKTDLWKSFFFFMKTDLRKSFFYGFADDPNIPIHKFLRINEKLWSRFPEIPPHKF